MEDRHIVAIDLGTSKIGLAVAKVTGNDMQVIYYRESPSAGIRDSSIWNPKMASEAIRKAIEEAEEELGITIWQVVVTRPKFEVKQLNATGTINRDENECITEEEIADLKEKALNEFPLDDGDRQVIFGAVAQSFSTNEDFQLVERDVVGMMSNKLEGQFKIFVGQKKNIVSIDNTFKLINVMVAEKYFTPDLTAKSVLYESEMDNGVALIDFGAGVTSVSIYCRNVMRYYASIPFGGRNITADIKSKCPINETLAENIKLGFGICLPDKLQSLKNKTLRIQGDDGNYKDLPVKELSEIVTARAEEIVEAMLYEIEQSGLAGDLKSGIVITGGGVCLANLENLIREKCTFSVRTGCCKKMFSTINCDDIFSPSATAVTGMLLKVKSKTDLDCAEVSGESRAERERRLAAEKEAQRIEEEKEAQRIEKERIKRLEEEARLLDEAEKEEARRKAEEALRQEEEARRVAQEAQKKEEEERRKAEEKAKEKEKQKIKETKIEEENRRINELREKDRKEKMEKKLSTRFIKWVSNLFEDVAEDQDEEGTEKK